MRGHLTEEKTETLTQEVGFEALTMAFTKANIGKTQIPVRLVSTFWKGQG